MILCPLLSPQHYLLQIALKIFRCVAPEHVDDFLTVCLHSLLVDHLEDFTLQVVLQLFPRVSPDRERKGNYSSHKSESVTEISGLQQQHLGLKRNVPALQPRVQLGVVCAKDKYNIEPALGEEVTAVVVHDDTTFCHLVFKLVHHLQVTMFAWGVHKSTSVRSGNELHVQMMQPQFTCGESKDILCFLSPVLYVFV